MSPKRASLLWDRLSPPSRSVVLARLGVAGPRSAAKLAFCNLSVELRSLVAGVMRDSDGGRS